MHIVGATGTGKTSCVENVLNILEYELKEAIDKGNKITPFRKLFLNGINYLNRQIFKNIYEFIFENKDKNYIQNLNNFFEKRKTYDSNISLNDPSNAHIVLIIDEFDTLINNSKILYTISNWTEYEYSKLIVILISNKYFLNSDKKILSRIGENKIMFKPYKEEELKTIINNKFGNTFSEDAINLTCIKVATINGDIRRVFKILEKAKEINSKNNLKYKKNELIPKNDILNAYKELFNSKINFIKSLQISEKIIIASILLMTKEQKSDKIKLSDLFEKQKTLFEKYNTESDMSLNINWDEYKAIIYRLLKIKLLKYGDEEEKNFCQM